MRNVINLFCLLLCLCLVACTSAPSSEVIKIQVAKHVLKNGKDKIFIFENFQKINGLSNKDGSYIADVSYDLVFRKGVAELTQELEQTTTAMDALGAGLEMMTQLVQYGQFSAGERLSFHEKHKLIKTEQGWRLASDFALK